MALKILEYVIIEHQYATAKMLIKMIKASVIAGIDNDIYDVKNSSNTGHRNRQLLCGAILTLYG